MLIVQGKPEYGQDNDADKHGRPAITIERNAEHGYRSHERNVASLLALVGIAFIDGPKHGGNKQQDIDYFARIERTTQHIDKEKFEPTAHGYDTRNDSIEHGCHDSKRNKQRNERTFEFDMGELAITEHQNDGRNTKQIEQVHADTEARHIGNQHQPTVTVRLVGMVFPLQNEPKHDGRKGR